MKRSEKEKELERKGDREKEEMGDKEKDAERKR
jgi:hypothetical protein